MWQPVWICLDQVLMQNCLCHTSPAALLAAVPAVRMVVMAMYGTRLAIVECWLCSAVCDCLECVWHASHPDAWDHAASISWLQVATSVQGVGGMSPSSILVDVI